MRLEQLSWGYLPRATQQTQQDYFVVRGLEQLSAIVLYTGEPCGEIGGGLTIRPISPNVSLHIHEGAGGTAQLKTFKNEYQSLSSYEAAMLDLLMDDAGLKKILTTDKCKRKGRK